MNISIIIPNFNGRHLLEKNLPKVAAVMQLYKGGTKEIIIVDDASVDTSVNFLKTFIESHASQEVILIEHKKNRGFSSAVNKGVAHARGEILILLNTDVVPESGFINLAVAHFKDETTFAVGFLDKSIEDGKAVLRGRGIGEWKRGFLMHRKGDEYKTNTLWASGGSSAFRKQTWELLGGLYALYNPFYWEDIDLSYRALKAGYSISFDKSIVVIHEHEKGTIRSLFSPQDVKTIAYRNQLYFVWINADIGMLLQHILWMPYHFMSALIRLDIPFFAGFFKALSNCIKVLHYRRKAQKLFRKSDTIIQEYMS
jgi:GT2 family glycosyltransferase